MHHRPPPPARPLVVLAAVSALASALLGGCAEMHRGAEAVGRVGGASAAPVAVAADDDVAPSRPNAHPDIRTVRPRGAPRAPAADMGERAAEPAAAPAVTASAVPSPRQIFDFHPAGSSPDSWRQPFVIDTNDGPLAADVRRSTAELKTFLADQKAGAARRGGTDTAAGVDGAGTGTMRRRCGEMDVAQNKPGCAVPRPGAAAAQR